MYHSLINHSPSLLTAFCHEKALNFVTYFFSISWKHVVFRPLILLMWTVFFFFYNIDSSLFSRTTSPLLNKWFANIFFPTNFLLLLLSFLLLAFFIWGNTGLLHYIFHGQHYFLLLYTLHWQRGKSISISLRKNSLFNNVVGASIVKKMHVPTQKNEPQPKPPGSYKR